MRVKAAVLERDAGVARKNRIVWVAAAAVIAALVISLVMAVPRAFAQDSSGLPNVDSATLSWIEMGRYYSDVQAQSLAADSARWVALGSHYDSIKQSLAGDAARWAALGSSYEAGIQLSLAADSARWVALGSYYSGLQVAASGSGSGSDLGSSPELVYSRGFAQPAVVDVSHFYAERMRVQAHEAAAALAAVRPSADDLAKWTDPGTYYRALAAKAALAAVRPSADDLAKWTDPGAYYRALESRSAVVASVPGRDPAELGANPELAYSAQAPLILAQIFGPTVCSVPASASDSVLGENPELAYSQHFIAEFVVC